MKSRKVRKMKCRKRKKRKKNTLHSDRAVEYILTRDIESLSRLTEEKIAEVLEISPAYLLKKFKIDQQIPLSRFIMREKIHRAVFILEKNHTVPIAELSEKLGFYHIDDFVREFESYLAIEPGRYRDLKIKTQILNQQIQTDELQM